MDILHDTLRTRAAKTAAIVVLALGAIIMTMGFSACADQSSEQSQSTSQASFASVSDRADSASSADADTASDVRTLVCIGDSITYGYGVGDPAEDAWPALLGEKLGTSWNVVNLGVSGTTMLDEGTFPYRSTGNVERAIALDADMAIIMLGTNDSADPRWDIESYRTQLSGLVDELENASTHDVQIVLMAPPCTFFYLNETPRHDSINQVLGEAIRPTVQDIAEEKGARYIDLYEFTEGHPGWFPDELHPNEEGNAAFADYLYGQIFGES